MAMNPHVARKAQDEIDAVVGADGSVIPGFGHMNELPYCFALTREVCRYASVRNQMLVSFMSHVLSSRWAPATPIVFPHYSDHDDEYKGYKVRALQQSPVLLYAH